MGGLDPAKIFLLLVIALVVVGPERLPGAARQLGGAWRELNQLAPEVRRGGSGPCARPRPAEHTDQPEQGCHGLHLRTRLGDGGVHLDRGRRGHVRPSTRSPRGAALGPEGAKPTTASRAGSPCSEDRDPLLRPVDRRRCRRGHLWAGSRPTHARLTRCSCSTSRA